MSSRSLWINFVMSMLQSDSAGPDGKLNYIADATSAGIPSTHSSGCFSPLSAAIP
jgi:hypothetical protein